MKLNDVVKILNADVILGENNLEKDFQGACGCDLMSDVLRFAKSEVILLTGLTNQHALRTAEMANIECIIFVRSKMPPSHVLEEAKELGMTILRTEYPMYESCGLLYKNGLGEISSGGFYE